MKLITLVPLVLILIVINYLFRRGIRHIKKRNYLLDYIKRYLPVLELLGWSVFLLWVIDLLFSVSTFNSHLKLVVIILVFAFLGWFVLRDFIAGVQVKTRFNLVKGQKLYYNKMKGEIKKLGFLALGLKADNGSDVIIPYANIDQKEIRLNYLEEGESEARFTIDLDAKYDEQETVEKLVEMINNSAWCSHKSKPAVVVIDENKTTKKYEITFKPNVSDGAKKLKIMISKLMN